MSNITQEQRQEVFFALTAKLDTARNETAAARRAFENAPTGGMERELAAMMLELHEAKYEAIRKVVSDYYDNYVEQRA